MLLPCYNANYFNGFRGEEMRVEQQDEMREPQSDEPDVCAGAQALVFLKSGLKSSTQEMPRSIRALNVLFPSSERTPEHSGYNVNTPLSSRNSYLEISAHYKDYTLMHGKNADSLAFQIQDEKKSEFAVDSSTANAFLNTLDVRRKSVPEADSDALNQLRRERGTIRDVFLQLKENVADADHMQLEKGFISSIPIHSGLGKRKAGSRVVSCQFHRGTKTKCPINCPMRPERLAVASIKEQNMEQRAERRIRREKRVLEESSETKLEEQSTTLNNICEVNDEINEANEAEPIHRSKIRKTNSAVPSQKTKGRRWIRFACDKHRREHARCPDNCQYRKKSTDNADEETVTPESMETSSTTSLCITSGVQMA